MTARVFGTLPDGSEIREATVAAGDLSASVLTYGAIVRDLRIAGIDHPLVLGFDNLDGYVHHSPYFGAVVGRFASRIGRGRFSIDGRSYQVSRNENDRHHLHGGFVGFGNRAWRLIDHDRSAVTLALSSADGEEGYPGNVEARVTYRVEPPATLVMEAEAITDAPTLVNLAQHSYFNLDDSLDILDHHVQIFADAYTPTDADNIPTGEITPVEGTDFDFRSLRPIRLVRDGARIPYDKNFVIDRDRSSDPRPHARLVSQRNSVALAVTSTEPGVQFYDGCMMTSIPVPGLGGRRYGLNGGCCFEPQVYPDAPNHTHFPSSILRPGETYRQVTLFAFSRA